MKTVAVDVDDVCLDLVPTWIALYNSEFDDDLDWHNINEWGVHKFVRPEAQERIYEYIQYPDVFWASPVIFGALEGVKVLRLLGFRVIFVTANNPENVKEKWLIEKGFLKNVEDFVQAYDKSLINADYLFDDKFENCRDFKGTAMLKNRPYNTRYQWSLRADGWKEFLEFIASERF